MRLELSLGVLSLRKGDDTWTEVALTHLERRLLLALAARLSQPVSIDRLLDEVWASSHVSPHAVEALVSRLRAKLGTCRGMLSTVPGAGYRLGPARPSGVRRRVSR